MATELTIALNAKTDKIHLSNPKNPGEHIPCRYVGIIEEEILPFTEDVLRPVIIDGINPTKNFIMPMMNGKPMQDDKSWEMPGKIYIDTDRMFCRDSKYIALYHEFSGVPNEEFDCGFPRAYFLSTAIYYDMLREQEPFMLLTEAFIDPQMPDLNEVNPDQDLNGFLRDFDKLYPKNKRMDMTVHSQLVSYKMGFPVGMNFDMAFKTDDAGKARRGWKRVLAHASKHMEKINQKKFVNAFLALGAVIDIPEETLEVSETFKIIVGTHLRTQNAPTSFVLRQAKALERD